MSVEGLLVSPCLAYHEYVASCATLKHIVGDASLLALRLCYQGEGSVESLVVFAWLCLKETVLSDHNK